MFQTKPKVNIIFLGATSLVFTNYEVEVRNFVTSVEWWPELLEGDWRELLLESLNQLQNVRLEACLVVQTSTWQSGSYMVLISTSPAVCH